MRSVVRTWMVAASIAGIVACGRVTESSPKEATPAASRATNTTSNAFNVEITLTPAARERLVSQHESLIVSADYFGVFAERIRARLGADAQDPPFVGMLSNGASGDVNGVDLRAQTPGARGYDRMHEVADALATAAAQIIGKAEHRADLELAVQFAERPLAVRKPDAAQLDWARSVLASREAGAAKPSRPVIYARETLGLAEKTVKSRLHEARQRLGRVLQSEEI